MKYLMKKNGFQYYETIKALNLRLTYTGNK
jgi:hypothetical protein